MVNKTKYMYDKYTSLFSYCKQHNLDYVSVRQRVVHGATPEQAVEDELKGADNKLTLFYKGVPLRQYCEDNNIRYNTVITRISRGRSIEDAIEFYDMRYDPDKLDI